MIHIYDKLYASFVFNKKYQFIFSAGHRQLFDSRETRDKSVYEAPGAVCTEIEYKPDADQLRVSNNWLII